MSRVFITTVGTSLLTNRDNRPWAGWSREKPFPDLKEARLWLQTADPAAASAELNTLSKLSVEQGEGIFFLHSDTHEGEWCARALADFAERRWKSKPVLKKITGLHYAGGSWAAKGLRALSSLLLESIREAEQSGRTPILCATGGFKSEIAFSNLIGILTGTEVYYIHEQFRELVRLPALPVREDREFFTDHREIIEWLDEAPRTAAEAQSRLAAHPRLADLVDEASDGNIYLNPAADLLFRYFREFDPALPPAWPTESARLPKQKNQVSSQEHHRPEGWKTLLEKLCAHPYVDSVRYADFSPGQATILVPPSQIKINYKRGDDAMGLLVETTATSKPQLERIEKHIRKTILR